MPYSPSDLDAETYDHLKAIARRIYNERANHSLQPTQLLHEAWERVNKSNNPFGDRQHFMATAAKAMRHVLIDRARARKRLKRGGPDQVRTTLSGLPGTDANPVSFLDFDRALSELQEASPQDAEVVLLRSIGGLTVREVATVLDIGTSTVERSWRRGRAFLAAKLSIGL